MSMSTLNRFVTPSLLGMPTEILSEIISLVPLASDLPVEKALLRLCAVCRDLNSMIKDTPSVWSTIQVDSTTPRYSIPLTDTNADSVFPTTKLALVYSRTKPLDIEFTVPQDSDEKVLDLFSIDICDALMHLLLTQSHRIRSFHLKGTSWTHHVVVTSALEACRDLPSLRRWEQECVRSSGLAREFSFLLAGYTHWDFKAPFLSSSRKKPVYIPPSLEVVSISASSYCWSKFACSNITELHLSNIPGLDRPTNGDLLAILAGVKDTLKRLELSYMLQIQFLGTETLSDVPLVLSCLDTLYLAYTTAVEITTFLPHIETPNLRHLSLTAHGQAHIKDNETKEMLTTVMAVVPLEKLESLSLKRIPFRDFAPTPALSREEMEKSKIAEYDLPLTLRFIRRLKSLLHLRLRGGYTTFTDYARYPVVSDCRPRSEWGVNLQTLEALCIEAYTADEALAAMYCMSEFRVAVGVENSPPWMELVMKFTPDARFRKAFRDFIRKEPDWALLVWCDF